MRLGLSALVLLSACAALCSQARADEIYSFTTQTANSVNPNAPPAPLTMTFDLLDAAVESGSVNIATTPNLIPQPTYATGADEFAKVGYSFPGGGNSSVSSSPPSDEFKIAMTFAADGDVTSSAVTFVDFSSAAFVSGADSTASGGVATDDNLYACFGNASQSTCSVSGAWSHTGDPLPPASPVPEPATFALLGAALIGLGVARRRTV